MLSLTPVKRRTFAVEQAVVVRRKGTLRTHLAAEQTGRQGQASQHTHAALLRLREQQLGRALADAKLAQSMANSTKAQATANALQDDIRILREELDRAGP